MKTIHFESLVTILLVCFAIDDRARGNPSVPLVFERVLPMSTGRAGPTFCDYNGDGFDDLMCGASNRLDIVSGRDGSVLRSYTGEPNYDKTFGNSFESIPDGDADGLRDFLVGAPFMTVGGLTRAGVVYGIGSREPGGQVDSIPLLYRIPNVYSTSQGAFGYSLGATPDMGLIGWDSGAGAMFVNPATGSVQAYLKGATGQIGFGATIARIGDLNGDGVADVAIGDPNYHNGFERPGRVYVVDGTVNTSQWTTVTALPAGKLLATLVPATTQLYLGAHSGSGDREVYANLGALPSDGTAKRWLIVVGCPSAFYYSGGFAAYVLTENANHTFDATEVASYKHNPPNQYACFGKDVLALGDVNGDGIGDVALLDSAFQHPTEGTVGRVCVVSGTGLLDGFSSNDILSEMTGRASGPKLSSQMRFLGDYDHDGRAEMFVATANPTGVAVYEIVPEPSTFILLGMGAAGLLGVAWRRKRTRSNLCVGQ